MSTRSIECQIARGQISRYLGGDAFSPEAIAQLEAHVSGCSDCKLHLNERKSALQSMLGKPQNSADDEQAPAPEVTPRPSPRVQAPATQTVSAQAPGAGMLDLLKSVFLPKAKAEPAKQPTAPSSTAQPATLKSLAYSIALALVLGAMSLASRNMDRILGPKAGVAKTEASVASNVTETTREQDPVRAPRKSKAKHSRALKPLTPIHAEATVEDEDAAKAARAARNAVLARKARAKLKGASTRAAQSLNSDYATEPAPKLRLPGKRNDALLKVNPSGKAAGKPFKTLKSAPKSPVIHHLAKATSVRSKPKMQIEAHRQRRSKPSDHIVKKRTIRKTHRSKTSSGIHLYAPEAKP